MGSMPEVISKGSIFRKLETVLNNRPNRPTILAALQAGTPILPIASTAPHDLGLTAGEQTHLQQDWLTDPNWLVQPVEPIVRKALETALERAMNPTTGAPPALPRPLQLDIDCYWICHPGHGSAPPSGGGPRHDLPEPLEISISWNGHQVTVLFHTPEPDNPPAPVSNLEDIVVVKQGPTVVPVHW
jgi:hypothetical protein